MYNEESLNAWIQQLEEAFKPYPEFIAQISAKIEALEAELALERIQRLAAVPVSASSPAPKPMVTSTAEKAKLSKALEVITTQVYPERKVLLVDDAEINRVLMSHYFKGLPVKLDFAKNGDIALEKCKETQFDLIVIDEEIQNPKGSELAATLKSGGASGTFIALSNLQNEHGEPIESFAHRLSRGLPREEFIERLKSYLWAA